MNIYAILCIIAFLEFAYFLVREATNSQYYHTLFYLGGLVSCIGNYTITVTGDLQAMLTGNIIAYSGGLACCIFMMLIIAELCKVEISKHIKWGFAALYCACMFFVATAENNHLYYKSVRVVEQYGMYFLDKDRGPAYICAILVIIGANLLSLGIIIYSFSKRRRVSVVTISILLAMEVLSTTVYLIPRILHLTGEPLPFVYVIAMAGALVAQANASMYDISANLVSLYEQRTEFGYLCIDRKKRFMGASDVVYRVASELNSLNIDTVLSPAKFKAEMPHQVVSWICDYVEGVPGTPTENMFGWNGKFWEATIRKFKKGFKEGFLIEFHDDTRDMQHIKEVEHERELTEQARKDAEAANASKSAFLAVVSHEIRTPMNAVVGMTDLLLRDGTNLDEKQVKYLTNIKNSGQALVMIVNDILDQSKIEAGKMEIVEDVYQLRPMVSDVLMIIESRIGEGKPLQLIQEIDDDIPDFLVGDGLRIRQILINLMNNAVKFTEEGHIKLSLKHVADEEGRIKIAFSVSDTGQGIRPEDLARLGQAFTQVDVQKNHGKEGTGLGLSISRDFISMMGGQLEVSSTYGEGSDFHFTIYQGLVDEPEEVAKTAAPKASWKEEEFTAPDARILVVDDTEFNLVIMEELLAPIGMSIDTVTSGEEALKMVADNEYDLIFMDYMMPQMDGVEATGKIRALTGAVSDTANVPIVALTGDSSAETRALFDEAGINGLIEKPVYIAKLKEALLQWIPAEKLHRD